MNRIKSKEGAGLFQRLYHILKEVERMANKIFNTRVKNKRDTEANWTSKNPVLLNGEIAIVDTTSGETRFKVGDGTNRYSQLPFQDAATLANYVKTTRKINNKALSSDISLTASDVGALPSTTTALKNPNALTFTGAVTGSYDGSAAKTVAIPSVDTALSGTSTNPVQNKVITEALSAKVNATNPILKDYVYVTSGADEGVVMHSDEGSIDGISTLELESMKGNGVTIGGLENVADPEALGRDDIAVSYAMMKDYVDNNKPSVATTSANGLMSADDKTKLDGIATGANKTTVDISLSASSFNPISNSAVVAGLDEKLDTAGGAVGGVFIQDGIITLPEEEPTISTAAITKGYVDNKIAVHATTSVYGTTKLSNSVTSSSKTLAATPYAVKTALAQAKAYVDSSITAAINSSY